MGWSLKHRDEEDIQSEKEQVNVKTVYFLLLVFVVSKVMPFSLLIIYISSHQNLVVCFILYVLCGYKSSRLTILEMLYFHVLYIFIYGNACLRRGVYLKECDVTLYLTLTLRLFVAMVEDYVCGVVDACGKILHGALAKLVDTEDVVVDICDPVDVVLEDVYAERMEEV